METIKLKVMFLKGTQNLLTFSQADQWAKIPLSNQNDKFKMDIGTGEMAYWEKAVAAKLCDLSLMPGTHIPEEENPPQIVL